MRAERRVVALIQARMSSTRLPGKVLQPIGERAMLDHVVLRARAAKRVQDVVVATSTDGRDDAIVAHCARAGFPVQRGSLDDVLDRYHHAAKETRADVVVRITSDCPFLDPALVDRVVEALGDADYASNVQHPRTYPRGLDVEAFTRAALERAWREDADAATREHVTPYIHRQPGLFRLAAVISPVDHSAHRWTVDTDDDMHFARTLAAALPAGSFAHEDALRMLARHPEWSAINRHVEQKVVP